MTKAKDREIKALLDKWIRNFEVHISATDIFRSEAEQQMKVLKEIRARLFGKR